MNKARWAGITVAVGLIGAGTVAYAAIPDPSGTVHGCYNKGGLLQDKGALRVVQSGEKCRSNELAMSWNQKGQPGPQGVAGPAGVSAAYQGAGTGVDIDGWSVTVTQLSVPAGSYLLLGKVVVASKVTQGTQTFYCSLEAGDESEEFSSVRVGAGEDAPVTVQNLVTLPQPRLVALRCGSLNGGTAYNAKLTALNVGAAHVQ